MIGAIGMSDTPQTVLESLLNLVMTINDEDHGSDLPPVAEALTAIERIVEEQVIGQNPCPIVCHCDAPVTAMCVCTGKFGNELRGQQRAALKQALYGEKE